MRLPRKRKTYGSKAGNLPSVFTILFIPDRSNFFMIPTSSGSDGVVGDSSPVVGCDGGCGITSVVDILVFYLLRRRLDLSYPPFIFLFVQAFVGRMQVFVGRRKRGREELVWLRQCLQIPETSGIGQVSDRLLSNTLHTDWKRWSAKVQHPVRSTTKIRGFRELVAWGGREKQS